MRRPIRTTATAFAMLVLVAGGSIASDNAAANDQNDELTAADCESFWPTSQAYGTCGGRTPVSGRAPAPGSIAETVEAVGDTCVITTSCAYYEVINGALYLKRRNTNWQGRLESVTYLQNCDGELTLEFC